jgi:hypothetical protein
MIKTIKTPIKWTEEYEVNNIIFSELIEAKSYNNLLKNPNVLEKIKIVDKNGKPILLNEIGFNFPEFCYILISENLPFQIHTYSLFTFLNGELNRSWDEVNSVLPTEKGIYYNDYSNHYQGSYGFNGFVKLKEIQELEKQKKDIEEQIANTKKVIDFFK